ncbi:MAG: hypothetical protein JO297_15420 [Nitrososphaeraceae archaeon]|nr:hypothetical protein [Nitrososphaeraceae archaeon]
MSKVNTSKNDRQTGMGSTSKSIGNGGFMLLLAVSMASLLAMCMLSVSTSISIAHAQTTANKSGTIASIQKDQAGTWKLSGTWNFNNINSNSPTFTSTFSMAKLDGSAMHKHTINDFKLNGTLHPTKTSTGTTYTGTATVSMKEGLVSNVPTSITLSNNGNISIMVDPKMTSNHFGNTPIEGRVTG